MTTQPTTLIPGRGVDKRYGITGRTRNRWKQDPDLGFPRPITINGRDYYEEHALEAWERQRAAASRNTSRRSPASESRQTAA